MPIPIALSEARLASIDTPSARDNSAMTDAAELVGFRVYHIPSDFEECETAENALWHVPVQDVATPGIWIGFIPSLERYQEIYAAALRRNIHLVNTPEEHQNCLELDRSLPALGEITAKTIVLEHPAELSAAIDQIDFPVFVRGSVRSRKESGWSACVAETREELEQLANLLWAWPYRSRGRVLVRQLLRLRHSRRTPNGFPLGREYRLFVAHSTVVGYGYYWEGDDPLASLNLSEAGSVVSLAQEAARRVETPFICVDIGQDEDNKWWVLEVGDGQFAGHGQTPLLPLWQSLYRFLSNQNE